jgi:dinuclear metal center YbgI/SA1388 family protein
MKLRELVEYIDREVPLSFQEDYDNSGLQVGNPDQEVNSALLTLDITEEVLEEAIERGCDIIVSHHPLIFKPLKRLTVKTATERIISKSILNGIAIYASHTNLDAMDFGVSRKMAEKLGLKDVRVLVPLAGKLRKVATFIPTSHYEKVSKEVFEAGAGKIGNYDRCGFGVEGIGSFRPGEGSTPFVGSAGKEHKENEIRFETVFWEHDRARVIDALLKSHPYEEVAYDIYPLENNNVDIGFGCIGFTGKEIDEMAFLNNLKEIFGANGIRYTKPTGRKIRKVALCGGSGSGFLKEAIAAGADVFVTADVKYHTFFDADGKILIADIGHYESEIFSLEILKALIIKKFPTFAILFSGLNSNPINYL